jgi:branched-chain amino acid transport system permease protein
MVSALTLGSVYALMAVGLALIWGGLGILNLAQGALFMVGAYTAFSLARMGANPWLGVLAAGCVAGAVGLALYAGPLRPLLKRKDAGNAFLIATVSIAAILENAALLYFGPRDKAVPELATGAFRIAGTPVTYNALLILIVAIVLLSALALILKVTRFGIAIRAVAQNVDGARLSGVNPNLAYILVFFISSALAGVSGVLLSSIYFLNPYVGQTYLLTALVVTILGGLGSVTGALGAAYIVGFIQTFVSFYLGVRWSLPVLFAAIIAVLIFMPTGLAGAKLTKRL